MDDVKAHLNEEPDVDKFLDETNLFDDWEWHCLSMNIQYLSWLF